MRKIKKTLVARRVPFFFTNGQLFSFFSAIDLTFFRLYFFSKIDFFSNKLWESLDKPRALTMLLRFERQYITRKYRR